MTSRYRLKSTRSQLFLQERRALAARKKQTKSVAKGKVLAGPRMRRLRIKA